MTEKSPLTYRQMASDAINNLRLQGSIANIQELIGKNAGPAWTSYQEEEMQENRAKNSDKKPFNIWMCIWQPWHRNKKQRRPCVFCRRCQGSL